MNITVRKYTYIIVLLFIAGCLHLYGQQLEQGRYPIYNFTTKEYNALDQNWCAVKDQRGIMYFGNNQGILEYDGVNWKMNSASDGAPVHSLDLDSHGRLYFGSVDLFGYLYPDSLGRLATRLLSDEIDEAERDFGEIWATHVTSEGVVFQSYNDIFLWSSDSLQRIHSEEEIYESYYISQYLVLCFRNGGMAYLKGNTFQKIEDGEMDPARSILGIIEQRKNKFLIVTDGGFYHMEFGQQGPNKAVIRRLYTKNERYFRSIDLNNAIALSNGRISLGTWGNGMLVIDSLFNVENIITKESGLQDNVIQGQYFDGWGNLWLELSSGISRVEIDADLTQIGDTYGLEGIVQDITRYKNNIYVSTNTGLYYLDRAYINKSLSNLSLPEFKLVESFDEECWDIMTFSQGSYERLLVITNQVVYEVNERHERKVLLEDYAYTLKQSGIDPNRVFIGLESGLISLYRTQNSWRVENTFTDLDEMITSISENIDGNLWLGTPEELLFKIDFDPVVGEPIKKYTLYRYDGENELPSGPYIVSQYQGRPLFATNKGFYTFNRQAQLFERDSILNAVFEHPDQYIHRQSIVADTAILIITYDDEADNKYKLGLIYPEGEGQYHWLKEPFLRISKELNHALYRENNGIIWIGGKEGLHRYRYNAAKDFDRNFSAYIRKVELGSGGLLFGGTFFDHSGNIAQRQYKDQAPVLKYQNNSLIFTFGSQPVFDESFTYFSYYLVGNDKGWSEWTREPTFKEYTNLREGKYNFQVKSRNIYGRESEIASYEFTILAPWYRKPWAFLLYFILAVTIVYLIVIIYTRRLREIIRERTAEVVAQKEVIEEKNNDIMDSMMYAEKIQRAIIPSEDELSKLNLDGFILFLPRDIVSGDFYWLGKKDGKIITVAADCTGHGVPGAFMSMLGVAFLNNIVASQKLVNAAKILNDLRSEVIAALKQTGQEGEQKDGMDLALHIIDYEKMKLEFAGANNPLILIRNNEIIQVKADRMPIGIHERVDQPFTNNVMDIEKGDLLYIFSDGFQDQFGGPKNKKFMIKRMKELLLEIQDEPMLVQKELLHKAFKDWIQPTGVEQVDDIIIIGIRI